MFYRDDSGFAFLDLEFIVEDDIVSTQIFDKREHSIQAINFSCLKSYSGVFIYEAMFYACAYEHFQGFKTRISMWLSLKFYLMNSETILNSLTLSFTLIPKYGSFVFDLHTSI